MITRQILRLPWFLSTPLIVSGAVVLAVLVNLVAGTYFERTFLDEADPLAQIATGASSPVAIGAPAGGQIPTAPSGPAAAQSAAPAATDAPAVARPPDPASAATPPAAVQAASSPPASPQAAPQSGPVLLSEGTIVDGDPGHPARGLARLIRGTDGGHTLRFEEFSVVNGPDVFVILSPDPTGSRDGATVAGALNLGRLRATNGNINYAVPAGADLSAVRSVIIYCRAFHVVMGAASLEAR